MEDPRAHGLDRPQPRLPGSRGWANEHSDPAVQAAFFVAPPDPYGDAFPPDAGGFAAAITARLEFPSMVVASRDDPYAGIDFARALAETWGSRFVDLGAQGHINAGSGLGDWEEGWQLLQAFLREADGSRLPRP